MHTQVVIALLGILFFATTMQGRRISHQERYGSNYGADRHFIEAARSLHRQKVREFRQQSEQNTRGSDDKQQQFREDMLEAHNSLRGLLCLQPLTLDDELNKKAQIRAEFLAGIESLDSQSDGVTENSYMYDGSDGVYSVDDLPAYIVAYDWFVEIDKYNFNKGGFSPATKHFTLLAWKSTEKLGVGIAFNDNHKQVYIVVLYKPSGNQDGQYEDNIELKACY